MVLVVVFVMVLVMVLVAVHAVVFVVHVVFQYQVDNLYIYGTDPKSILGVGRLSRGADRKIRLRKEEPARFKNIRLSMGLSLHFECQGQTDNCEILHTAILSYYFLRLHIRIFPYI